MPDVEAGAPQLTQIERVVDTFVTPSATFRDILRSASWWLPFVILALCSLGLSYTIDHKVGFEQVTENQLHLTPSREAQVNALEPAARAEALQRSGMVTRYIAYAYPVVSLIFAAFGALILWATFNFGLGARTTYQQMLAVWFYASLPRIFVVLIAAVTLWFGSSPESFVLQYPAGTNLAYYLSDSSGWLRTLLSFFDIFGLWTLVLLVIGTAIVAHKKTSTAAAAIVGWWVLILAGSVLATAAFS